MTPAVLATANEDGAGGCRAVFLEVEMTHKPTRRKPPGDLDSSPREVENNPIQPAALRHRRNSRQQRRCLQGEITAAVINLSPAQAFEVRQLWTAVSPGSLIYEL
jgi:hypothetical protein